MKIDLQRAVEVLSACGYECEELYATHNSFQAGAASRDAEIHRLQMALADTEQLELGTAEKCDQLREQVALLREEVTRCRDWFEAQAKVKSKGGPSSWELMLLRDERDAADEALAATEPK